MKKLITIAILILFQIGNTFGQVLDTLKLYSVNELRNDVDSMTKYIEETHPNPFYKFPRNEFYKEADSIKIKINKPMSDIDFFMLIQPLIAKLEDGHTSIEVPKLEYLASNPFMFIYPVKLSTIEPFITLQGNSDAEIISINEIEANRIIKDIIKFTSGEAENFRLDCGANYFWFYLNKLYGMTDSYLVKYKIDDRIDTRKFKGIKYDSLIKIQKQDTTNIATTNQNDYSLKLIPRTKTAIIDFKSFNDLENFKIFIDSAFKQIRANKIENLIIDVRANGGGDSEIGDEFFQYISHCTFKQISKTIIKYSRLQKEDYKNIRVLEIQDTTGYGRIAKKPNGLMEVLPEDSISVKLRDNPLRFNGNIYLLTSSYTFSSAADFAQCFKYYNMGKIIGEETGGWIVCYADNIYGALPNSKLNFTISHKFFINIGATENDWHGVIPDIKVSSDKALDYTLKLINEKNK